MIKRNKKLLVLFFLSFFLLSFVIREYSTIAQEIEEQKITLDVKNMDIKDVLKMIAEQSALNIVISKSVKGAISIKLDSVFVKQALGAILKTAGYTYIEKDNILRICSFKELQREQEESLSSKVFTLQYAKVGDLKKVLMAIKTKKGKIELIPQSNQIIAIDTSSKLNEIGQVIDALDKKVSTKIYTLKYADPEEIEKKIRDFVSQDEGKVFSDKRINTVTVEAAPLIIKRIDDLIFEWDRQSQQVLIDARIFEVSLNSDKKFGINWQYLQSTQHSIGGGGVSAISSDVVFKIGNLDADNYNLILEALQTDTNTDILSNPKIVVANNKKAHILVGSSEPYIEERTDDETKITTRETKFVDVGVKLLVTPKISSDNFITMEIHPEVSTARRVSLIESSAMALAIDTTEADTTMIIKDGETIVLGGLIRHEKTKTGAKIPILGDIPLLGMFFKSKIDEIHNKEIIIFITPHILKEGSYKKENYSFKSDIFKSDGETDNNKMPPSENYFSLEEYLKIEDDIDVIGIVGRQKKIKK